MRVIRGRAGGASSPASGTFTGDVWMDGVLVDDEDLRINEVLFTPRARTYWHSHEGGQLLQVFRGRGFVCTQGEEPVALTQGDTVWVPAGEVHWHGGSTDSLLGHTATSFGKTTWMHEVSEDEYMAVRH